jgi:hypothetical protein
MGSLLLLGAAANSAAGLELFSYQDDLGQIIVTDSLEKVPEKFRGLVRREFVPTFRSRKVDKQQKLTIIEPANTAKKNLPEPSTNSSGSEMRVVAPPAESYAKHAASASRFMENIKLIQLNNERIYFLAENYSLTHPSILALQQTSMKKMQELEELKQLDWERGKSWKANAVQLVSRLKSIQYTINKWIRDGGVGLKDGFPVLLSVMRSQVGNLGNELKRIKADTP